MKMSIWLKDVSNKCHQFILIPWYKFALNNFPIIFSSSSFFNILIFHFLTILFDYLCAWIFLFYYYTTILLFEFYFLWILLKKRMKINLYFSIWLEMKIISRMNTSWKWVEWMLVRDFFLVDGIMVFSIDFSICFSGREPGVIENRSFYGLWRRRAFEPNLEELSLWNGFLNFSFSIIY